MALMLTATAERSTVTGCVTLTGFPAVVLPLAVIVSAPTGQALTSTAGTPTLQVPSASTAAT